jgi:hypothetical protein
MTRPKQETTLVRLHEDGKPDQANLVVAPDSQADRVATVLSRTAELLLAAGDGAPLTISVTVGDCLVSVRRGQVEPAPQLPQRRPETDPWHAADFREVCWAGRPYSFTPKQRLIVARLWRAWEEGTPEVDQQTLLRAADSDCVRLVDLFRSCPGWRDLILHVEGGRYRLAPHPSEAEGGSHSSRPASPEPRVGLHAWQNKPFTRPTTAAEEKLNGNGHSTDAD